MVDVQPGNASFTCQGSGPGDKLLADSAPAEVRMDGRIQQERVLAAIPCEVDEADQLIASESAEVDKASRQHWFEISSLVTRPRRREECVEAIAVD